MGFLGSILGSDQRKRAANAGAGGRKELRAGFDAAQGFIQPQLDAGQGTLSRLAAGIKPGGEFAQQFQSLFDPNNFAFNPTGLPPIGNPNIQANLPDAQFNTTVGNLNAADFQTGTGPGLPGTGFTPPVDPFSSQNFNFQADPGFQFRLQTGTDAIDRSAAARGKGLSGQTLQALAQFGQNLGSQEFSNARNRAFQENQQAFNRGLTLNDLAFNRATNQSNNLFNRGLQAGDRNFNRANTLNQAAFDRGLTLNDLAFNRATQQDTTQRAVDTANFNRGLALNDLTRNRSLQENQLAFDRARQQDLLANQRFNLADQRNFGRLSALAGIGTNAANNLANLRTALGQNLAGNLTATAAAQNAQQNLGLGRLGAIAPALGSSIAGGIAGFAGGGLAGALGGAAGGLNPPSTGLSLADLLKGA